jgi:phospholipid transport system substrate-binding protein
VPRSLLAVLAAACLLAPAAPARAGPATDVVERFHAALLEVMKQARSLDARARYERLAPRVEESFHLALMIRIASGSYWDGADATQRERLVAAFTRMSVGTYAHRFDGWSGERFETDGEAPGPGGTVLVRTRIVESDGESVALTYVMKPAGVGSFRIVDVLLAKGVSELAVRRSEYQSILAQGGVAGLAAALDRKADELVGAPG